MAKYQYLEVEQVNFTWHKAKGYYWVNQAKIITTFIPRDRTPGPPFLVPSVGETVSFQALKSAPTLFLEFASLEIGQEEINTFANNHGLLTEGEALLSLPDRTTVNGESFSFWAEEISDLKRAVDTWGAVNKEDRRRLNRIIKLDERKGLALYEFPYKDGTIKGIFLRRDQDPEGYKRALEGDVITRGKVLVQCLINEKLDIYNMDYPIHLSAGPQAVLNDQGELETYLAPKTLLAGIWIQLLRAATGERKFRRCESPSCNRWEDVTERQKNWRKHPECAARDRMRRSRERGRGE